MTSSGSAVISTLPLVVIAGPTASGKSALALALAERHAGVVINADSAQVYRDLRIVTARPSAEEEAHAPHRLFGHIDAADTGYSAARWADEARAVVAEVHAAGKLPILVGGTGLYLRTLIEGIAPVPPIDPAIRADVRAMPVADAHAVLTVLDPSAAARLHANDTTRVLRALEVVRSTGRPLADWQTARSGGLGDTMRLCALILLPPREWLEARIAARAALIADSGLGEVTTLLARPDLPSDAPIRRAIGVPELAGLVSGGDTRRAAVAALTLATRRYAKRQYTWFRHQPPPEWTRTDGTSLADQFGQIEIMLRNTPVDAQPSTAYRAAPQQGNLT